MGDTYQDGFTDGARWAREEITERLREIDVMDIGSSVTNMRYGLVAIDNFPKIGHVVPIQNKQPNESIRSVK